MLRVLFVCHGNICRSPMAEFIMKDLVHQRKLDALFEIASAATSTEELGNPVYPPARRELAKHSISCAGKTARQINRRDVSYYDRIYYMDSYNRRNLNRMFPDQAEKFLPLLNRDVADPWYTGDFTTTWNDILEGCTRILEELA